MKKLPVFWVLIVLAIASFVQAGCKKAVDYIEHHENTDLKICNIQKLTYQLNDRPIPLTEVFTYNTWGDPVSIIRPDVGTGRPNMFFNYNKKHLLTEYIGGYSNGVGYEFWHKYFYDANNRVKLDSVYYLLPYGPPSLGYMIAYAVYPFYDSQNRIIKDSFANIKPANNFVWTYAYDDRGNKTGNGIYDNKLNLHRTNKVWMFVDRDYSVNNPFTNAVYNHYNLPTGIPDGFNFLGVIYNKTTIQYACDELPPPLYK